MDTYICDCCNEIKESDFVAVFGSDILCEICFDKVMKAGESSE